MSILSKLYYQRCIIQRKQHITEHCLEKNIMDNVILWENISSAPILFLTRTPQAQQTILT